MSEKPIGFWRWAELDPDRLALVTPEERTFSFATLAGRVNQASHAFRGMNLRTGDGVAILLDNGNAWIEMLLAAQQIGLYITPINYHLTAPEVAYILSDCEAKVFVAGAEFAEVAGAAAREANLPPERCFAVGPIEGFRSYEELLAGRPTHLPDERIAGQMMNYTSGTTGRPKGVRREITGESPEEAADRAALLIRLFGIEIGHGVHLTQGPLYHTAPGAFTLSALHIGQSAVLMGKWDAEEALRRIAKYRVTATHVVPTMFKRLAALPEEVKEGYDLSSLTHVIHAAAPCPVDLKHEMLKWWGPVIWEYYAATEGGGTRVSPKEWLERPGTVGRPWPGADIKILGNDGNELPSGEPGTVYMKSARARFEYHKDVEKTRGAWRGDYFTVGDMGYLTEDGWLFLCDRKADMIISGGVNIYPAEIESVLVLHPKVHDVAVFGIPNEEWGEEVKAVIEPAEGIEASPELADELMTFARERLAKYKLPRSIEFESGLPRQPSGKLYKRKIKERFWQNAGRKI